MMRTEWRRQARCLSRRRIVYNSLDMADDVAGQTIAASPRRWAAVVDRFTIDASARGDLNVQRRRRSAVLVAMLTAAFALGWLVGAIWYLALIFTGGEKFHGGQAMTIFIGGPLAIVALVRLISKLDGSTARETLARDGRQPILYLRPFTVDEQGSIVWDLLRALFRLRSSKDQFESKLCKALATVGPVIAIGRPGERVPPRGASRVYLKPDGDDWKESVRGLIDSSRLVIIRCSEKLSGGTLWELNNLFSTCDPRRVLLALPRRAKSSRRKAKRLYAKLRKQLQGDFPATLPEEAGTAVFFAFGPNWSVRPLSTKSFVSELGSSEIAELLLTYLSHLEPDPRQIPFFQEAASAGDGPAMFALGRLSDLRGECNTALEWYAKAVKAGSAEALNDLGNLKRAGKSTDSRSAQEIYEAAVKLNYAPAMTNLGEMYLRGNGVPFDYKKAEEWLLKAVYAHDARAMHLFGVSYRDGLGGKADPKRSRDWFMRAGRACYGPSIDAIESQSDNARGAANGRS